LTAQIDVATDINRYFQDALQEAMIARGVDATDAAQHYLVGLLCDFAKPENLAKSTLDRPLTFLMRDALAENGAERFERLRSIGDGVMYVMGFFGSSLTRRGADRAYVMTLGSSAYGYASAMLHRGSTRDGIDVFEELARKYEGFVAAISELADAALSGRAGDTAVLRLYERWRETGSERLAAELAELGLCPMTGPEGFH
jgi:hypothetical protein